MTWTCICDPPLTRRILPHLQHGGGPSLGVYFREVAHQSGEREVDLWAIKCYKMLSTYCHCKMYCFFEAAGYARYSSFRVEVPSLLRSFQCQVFQKRISRTKAKDSDSCEKCVCDKGGKEVRFEHISNHLWVFFARKRLLQNWQWLLGAPTGRGPGAGCEVPVPLLLTIDGM